MNHTELRNYAPQARRDFIQSVTDRAAFYGVTAAKIEPATVKGDVAIIAGHAFPASVVAKRKKLVDRIDRDGFDQTMEALAYTWFNRFVAIRFMELHGYLEHGYRVLSHPDPTKKIPEILELAEHVDLPGLRKEKVIDLKLDGNKESELYQMLLLAQCHALHSAMPFLFEGIDDETELVLPENLLHSDSIIRKLVAASAPEDWQEVEVLGWLYQFYISERKDEVMARKSAVPTEDIPAVTQLFTPHWIVRYLVENSLGRLWLLNSPGSKLREQMPYYIEGDAETDFLKITKPEDIRLLDPACGSGHMLTYAFDVLFLIYEEEGYVPSEIPALILRHNLQGLEICPRAAQLAGMALVFKARAKSPRFFQPASLVPPRILALQNVRFDEGELRDYIVALDLGDLFNQPVLELLHQFEEATTFGSLIQPCLDEGGIAYTCQAIAAKDLGSQMFLRETHTKVLRVLEQAEYLTQRYHVVVANPPYMGSKFHNRGLKDFLVKTFPDEQQDTYTCFISRCQQLVKERCIYALITLPSWMALPTFTDFRLSILRTSTLISLNDNGRGVWGPDYGSCAFVFVRKHLPRYPTKFARLFVRRGEVSRIDEIEQRYFEKRWIEIPKEDLAQVPGTPLAYWTSAKVRGAFTAYPALSTVGDAKNGMTTGENDKFLRFWFEVDLGRIAFNRAPLVLPQSDSSPWVPYSKGGEFRKWFGNTDLILNWGRNGELLKANRPKTILRNPQFYFREAITWSLTSMLGFGARHRNEGFTFDVNGMSLFVDPSRHQYVLAFLNSLIAREFLEILNPTIAFQSGDIARLPLLENVEGVVVNARGCLQIATQDWNNVETSWDFQDHPLLRPGLKGATLEASWRNWETQSTAAIRQMKELETANNRFFIAAYGLADELKPEVPEEQITLARADAFRDVAAFLSYAVGCIMGRYSLDKTGLILADEGGDSLDKYLVKVGKPFDSLIFVPNEDGMIPVLDGDWFKGDIVARVHAFLRATFGEANLEANLRFIEESLGKDLRKYFLIDFYKDHPQTYKKRPIYWLFSSGKERAFQVLVYLHRYHEGTLSRMRTEYVIPLQGKIASRSDQLADDIQKATSTSHRKKMEKERDKLVRQRTELQAFDEKLRHYADQRIQLDLDEGVKVNYGRFGDLLAEVKAITGGSDE